MRSIFLHLITVVCASSLIMSCSKEEDETIYSIQGTLYRDCSKQPVQNYTLRLNQSEMKYIYGQTVGGVLATALTDNEGRFEFQFKDKGSLYQSIDFFTGTSYSTIVDDLPPKTNLLGLELYLNASYSANIYIDVKNSYTSADTLFYTDANVAKHRFIVGPFTSQLINQVVDQPVHTMRYPYTEGVFQYWINNDETARLKYFPISECNTVDVTVVIE